MRILCLLLILSSFSAGQTPEPSHWQAPKEASVKPNPLKGKPELAAGGQKVFVRMCASCHDAGDKQLGPRLSAAAVQQQSDGVLFWKISNGNSRTGMPSFSMLPDTQRWQIVLYIRSLANRKP